MQEAHFAAPFMGTGQCLDTLNRVLAALSPGHSFRDSLQELLAALAEDMHFDRPHIVVQDPESGELKLSLSYGPADAPEAAYEPGSGITGQVFAEGRPIIVSCMQGRPDFQNRLFGRSQEEMARLAFISVPVRVENADQTEVIGTLSADTPTAPESELDLRCRFLETVATLVGRQVARLQEEMARQHFCMLPDEPLVSGTPASVIATSKSLRHVLRRLTQAGASRATVLLRGESGVGKEVFARALHQSGPRQHKPFVAVNCAALPESLIEAELFGYQSGAFTGARREGAPGRVREADGGTLFLDEIGDMPLSLQARLLRVLQDREVTPLGGGKPIAVDFALVCATHRHLPREIQEGRFREDLYYRLNGLTLCLPALRERTDFDHLLDSHLQNLMPHRPLTVATELRQRLRSHPWPGNVRQLASALRTACALLDAQESVIDWHHLPDDLALDLRSQSTAGPSAPQVELPSDLRTLSHQSIARALQSCAGNHSEAARILGIGRSTLYRKLREMGMAH